MDSPVWLSACRRLPAEVRSTAAARSRKATGITVISQTQSIAAAVTKAAAAARAAASRARSYASARLSLPIPTTKTLPSAARSSARPGIPSSASVSR